MLDIASPPDVPVLSPASDLIFRRTRKGTVVEPNPARRIEDRQFLLMHRAFSRTGGLITGDEVVQRMRRHTQQPTSALARQIVNRDVVHIAWESQHLLPVFQFEPATMAVRPGITAVVSELADVFDDWCLALWFAQPNAWLGDAAPSDLVVDQANAVVHAARADRFIALG